MVWCCLFLSCFSSSSGLDQTSLIGGSSFTDSSSSPNDGSDSSSLFHDVTIKNTGGMDVSDVLSSGDDDDDSSSMLLNVSAVRVPPSRSSPQPYHNGRLNRSATAVLDDLGLSGDLLGLVLGNIEDDIAEEEDI